MKHGDKAKKSAKGKTSGKKASSKVAQRPKISKASQGRSQARPAKISKSSSKTSGGNGKTSASKNAGDVNFSNPVVGAAFKRAVKKYPAAFRRLTD